jgi:hypothetical protein
MSEGSTRKPLAETLVVAAILKVLAVELEHCLVMDFPP